MVRAIDIKDRGVVDVTVSLTTPGCPIKNHFQTAVADAARGVAGVNVVNVGFDVLSDQEKAGLQRKLGRPGGLPEGSLAEVSNVICIGSGKGGVGKSSLTVNLAAALAADGKRVGRARRRRLGLLHPAHARPRRRAAEGVGRAQDPPARGPRPEGHVDRLLPRRGRGRRLARADAAQGAHPVPGGRGLGRARLPADRPAAGHGRRLDDAVAAPAAGEVRDRHDAAADGSEGGAAGGGDGRQGQARDRRRDREHVRLHDAVGRAVRAVRRGRRPGARGRDRRAAARHRSR